MLVDLAHASMETTQAALKVATRPVVVSHTGLDTRLGNDPHMAQMMRPRLISKEQAKVVAAVEAQLVYGRTCPTHPWNMPRTSVLSSM